MADLQRWPVYLRTRRAVLRKPHPGQLRQWQQQRCGHHTAGFPAEFGRNRAAIQRVYGHGRSRQLRCSGRLCPERCRLDVGMGENAIHQCRSDESVACPNRELGLI